MHSCTVVQPAHTCASCAIALRLDTTMTVSCPQRSLDIQCKSNLVEQGGKKANNMLLQTRSPLSPLYQSTTVTLHMDHGVIMDNNVEELRVRTPICLLSGKSAQRKVQAGCCWPASDCEAACHPVMNRWTPPLLSFSINCKGSDFSEERGVCGLSLQIAFLFHREGSLIDENYSAALFLLLPFSWHPEM